MARIAQEHRDQRHKSPHRKGTCPARKETRIRRIRPRDGPIQAGIVRKTKHPRRRKRSVDLSCRLHSPLTSFINRYIFSAFKGVTGKTLHDSQIKAVHFTIWQNGSRKTGRNGSICVVLCSQGKDSVVHGMRCRRVFDGIARIKIR
jgi:hypothetical protein